MFSRSLYCRCWNHVLFTKFTDQNISENLNILGCTICPDGNYMFKIKKRNTRARCEICSMLTIKTPERRHFSTVSIVDFEYINAGSPMIKTFRNQLKWIIKWYLLWIFSQQLKYVIKHLITLICRDTNLTPSCVKLPDKIRFLCPSGSSLCVCVCVCVCFKLLMKVFSMNNP